MSLIEKLKTAVDDMTTLEVATLTNKNDVELNLNNPSNDIFDSIKKSLTQTKLVAYTRFELDADSVNFINNETAYEKLVEGHKEMVIAAQEARKVLFDTVINAIKSGINALK